MLRESLLRLGEAVARDGLGEDVPHSAAADILLPRPPRVGQSPGANLAEDDEEILDAEIEIASNEGVRDALESGEVRLAAGTAWLWSREEMAGSVDVLLVDEAGQFSLANTLAVCQAADSVVLVGDPRQLEQPQQGVHPPGADVSALDHLLAAETTISSDRGLFLTHTRRLHPELCAFTSELFYRGRLGSLPKLERQSVHGPDPFDGSGLRFVPVRHAGNQNESPEEAEVVSELFRGRGSPGDELPLQLEPGERGDVAGAVRGDGGRQSGAFCAEVPVAPADEAGEHVLSVSGDGGGVRG